MTGVAPIVKLEVTAKEVVGGKVLALDTPVGKDNPNPPGFCLLACSVACINICAATAAAPWACVVEGGGGVGVWEVIFERTDWLEGEELDIRRLDMFETDEGIDWESCKLLDMDAISIWEAIEEDSEEVNPNGGDVTDIIVEADVVTDDAGDIKEAKLRVEDEEDTWKFNPVSAPGEVICIGLDMLPRGSWAERWREAGNWLKLELNVDDCRGKDDDCCNGWCKEVIVWGEDTDWGLLICETGRVETSFKPYERLVEVIGILPTLAGFEDSLGLLLWIKGYGSIKELADDALASGLLSAASVVVGNSDIWPGEGVLIDDCGTELGVVWEL